MSNLRHLIRGISQLDVKPKNPDVELSKYEKYIARLKAPISLSESIQTVGKLVLWIQNYHLGSPDEPWNVSKRLMRSDMPGSARLAGFQLFVACVQSRPDLPSVVRLMFFNAIEMDFAIEDFDLQIQALSALTKDGRDLSGFDLYICSTIRKWMDRALSSLEHRKHAARRSMIMNSILRHQDLRDVTKFSTQLVKFNFAILDESDVELLVDKVVFVCKRTGDEDDIQEALSFFDAVIRYGFIPPKSLPEVVNIVCSVYQGLSAQRTTALAVVSNLLKSHMVRATLQTLCKNIQGVKNVHDDVVLGALGILIAIQSHDAKDIVSTNLDRENVFQCMKDGLTSSQQREDRHQPTLDRGYLEALLEMLRLERIVMAFSYDDWELPFDILLILTRSLELSKSQEGQRLVPQDPLQNQLRLLFIDGLVFLGTAQTEESNCFPVHRMAELWSVLHSFLPTKYTLRLLQYYQDELCCYPSDPNWLSNIEKLGREIYLDNSQVEEVRIKVLEHFLEVMALVAKTDSNILLYPRILAILSVIDTRIPVPSTLMAIDLLTTIAQEASLDCVRSAVGALKRFMQSTKEQAQDFSHPSQRRGSTESDTSMMSSMARSKIIHNEPRSRLSNITPDPARNQDSQTAGSKEIATDDELPTAAAIALTLAFLYRFTSKPSPAGQYLFSAIVEIASSHSLHEKARLIAINFLGTIRADSERYLYLDTELIENAFQSYKTRAKPVSMLRSGHTPQYAGVQSRYTCDEKHNATENSILSTKGSVHFVLEAIRHEVNWSLGSAILNSAKLQLGNRQLFQDCEPQILALRSGICEQLNSSRYMPPSSTSEVKREDVMINLIEVLTTLMGYNYLFSKAQQDEIVAALQTTLLKYQKATPACIHILTICAYEAPLSTAKNLASILVRLSQLITSINASVPILEFLSALAKLPDQYVNFREEDYRRVFGVALQHIQHANALARDAISAGAADPLQQPMPVYVLTLAFDSLYAWFLALKLSQRPRYLNWVVDGLLAANPHTKSLDERGQVCYDFLVRFCYSNAEIRSMGSVFQEFEVEQSSTKSWVYGNAVLTMRTMYLSGLTEMTVRRPSGSVSFLCKPNSDLEALSIISSSDARAILTDEMLVGHTELKIRSAITGVDTTAFTPSHMLLQMVVAADLHLNEMPMLLPDDAATKRALGTFDRIPVVDFHKIGIVYVGRGQIEQQEILANTFGSPDYVEFLEQLGELVRLRGNSDIYTGGLDSVSDEDGEFAYAYREKISQIIFHTCTLMPTRVDVDPHCNRKKAHIGNDFVNIIWNSSNRPYKPDTISSDFNFVNIVVSPDAFQSTRMSGLHPGNEAVFKVKVLPHKDLPRISPATEWRLISKSKLPTFVRSIAMQCNVYAQIHHAKGAFTSMWRQRLEKITTLKQRVEAKHAEAVEMDPEKDKDREREKGGPGAAIGAGVGTGPGAGTAGQGAEGTGTASGYHFTTYN